MKEQLLCLVTPLDVGRSLLSVATQIRSFEKELDALFLAHGSIHYATFTLLPPSPEDTRNAAGHALALTLAVDKVSPPAETLDRLITLDANQTLQGIYGVPPGATDALRKVLLDKANLHPVTGGYIGARDRTVPQIRNEGRLSRHLRAEADRKSSSTRADARRLASELSTEALAHPEFAWARQPAPQGGWREATAPAWLRYGTTAGGLVAFSAFVLLISTLALIGFGNKLAVASLNESWIKIDPSYTLTVQSVLCESGPLVVWLCCSVLALLFVNGVIAYLVHKRRLSLLVFQLALILSVIGSLIVFPAVAWVALNDLSAAVAEEMRSLIPLLLYGAWVVIGLLALVGIVTASSLLAITIVPPHVSAGWLAAAWAVAFAAGLVLLHFALAALVYLSDRFQWPGKQWFQAKHPWDWQPVDRIAVVVFFVAVLSFLIVLFVRAVLRGVLQELGPLRLLDRNSLHSAKGLNHRLHQTAPSITACEAAWVDRTAAMVSLTEVRRPYWFFAPLTKFFLWMISSLGWRCFCEGSLGSISTIQFAHWHVIDKGRRLLFCANYDGDFSGYLDQFILGRFALVNLIWRWTHLGERPGIALGGFEMDAEPTHELPFPKTRLLLFSGCRREQQFKAYARASMLPFQYHFAAYDYRIGDILRSTRLRDALSAAPTPVNDALIMRALEA